MAWALATTSASADFVPAASPAISATSTLRTASMWPTQRPSSAVRSAATLAGSAGVAAAATMVPFMSWAGAGANGARARSEAERKIMVLFICVPLEASRGAENRHGRGALYSSLCQKCYNHCGQRDKALKAGRHGTGTGRDPAGAVAPASSQQGRADHRGADPRLEGQ